MYLVAMERKVWATYQPIDLSFFTMYAIIATVTMPREVDTKVQSNTKRCCPRSIEIVYLHDSSYMKGRTCIDRSERYDQAPQEQSIEAVCSV